MLARNDAVHAPASKQRSNNRRSISTLWQSILFLLRQLRPRDTQRLDVVMNASSRVPSTSPTVRCDEDAPRSRASFGSPPETFNGPACTSKLHSQYMRSFCVKDASTLNLITKALHLYEPQELSLRKLSVSQHWSSPRQLTDGATAFARGPALPQAGLT